MVHLTKVMQSDTNKTVDKASNNDLAKEDDCDFQTLNNQNFFFVDNNNKDLKDLKILSKYILEVSHNIKQYIKLPLKELLLLINLMELDDNKENTINLIEELKKHIKITIKNCKNILEYRFKVIEKNISYKKKDRVLAQNSWNSKLFIELVILVQKICNQKKIIITNEKFLICITEIYNYFTKLSIDPDPKFVNWFIEKFLCNNNTDHALL